MYTSMYIFKGLLFRIFIHMEFGYFELSFHTQTRKKKGHFTNKNIT